MEKTPRLSFKKTDGLETNKDTCQRKPIGEWVEYNFQQTSLLIIIICFKIIIFQSLEAIEYINTLPTNTNSKTEDNQIYHLLNAVAKRGDEDLLLRFFDLLRDHGYIKTHGHLIYAPIIQFYIDQ